MSDGLHWVGSWTTAPAPAEGVALANQTLRMNARLSIGGDTVRMRLSNAHGQQKLVVGMAHDRGCAKRAPASFPARCAR